MKPIVIKSNHRFEEIFALKTRAKTRKIVETWALFWDQTLANEHVEYALRLYLTSKGFQVIKRYTNE